MCTFSVPVFLLYHGNLVVGQRHSVDDGIRPVPRHGVLSQRGTWMDQAVLAA